MCCGEARSNHVRPVTGTRRPQPPSLSEGRWSWRTTRRETARPAHGGDDAHAAERPQPPGHQAGEQVDHGDHTNDRRHLPVRARQGQGRSPKRRPGRDKATRRSSPARAATDVKGLPIGDSLLRGRLMCLLSHPGPSAQSGSALPDTDGLPLLLPPLVLIMLDTLSRNEVAICQLTDEGISPTGCLTCRFNIARVRRLHRPLAHPEVSVTYTHFPARTARREPASASRRPLQLLRLAVLLAALFGVTLATAGPASDLRK